MYIEIHDWKNFDQTTLYFKLNNSLNMNLESTKDYKLAGIYAIYKNDLCLYVGQSKNLASRLATHLKGRYENATNIYIWNIEKIGFPEFRTYIKDIQDQIIIRCEKYLMTILKPIENINIDMSFIIYNEKEKPTFKLDTTSCYTIQNDILDLRITDKYPHNIENIRISLESYKDNKFYPELDNILKDESFKFFYTRGVNYEN